MDNLDPENQILRVKVHADSVRVVENIPLEEAKRIFDAAVTDLASPATVSLKRNANNWQTTSRRRRTSPPYSHLLKLL